MTRFAHPSLFRASAIDGRSDDTVARVLHLRVRVSNKLGFPIHPFAAWRVTTDISQAQVTWINMGGTRVTPPFDPRAVGGAYGYVTSGSPPESEWYWLSVDADPHGDDFAIDVIDRWSGRVLATRRKPPFDFGGTAMGILRVRGRGEVRGVEGVPASSIPNAAMDTTPSLVFGPPVLGGPWYQPDPISRDLPQDRLYFGANQRLGPLDRPDGSIAPLDPDDEVARVMTILAPTVIDEWLNAAFQDPTTPPPLVVRQGMEVGAAGRNQTASYHAADALLTMAVDPDVARYLGLATAVRPDESGFDQRVSLWLVAGEWMVANAVHTEMSGLSDPVPGWLPGSLAGLFPGAEFIPKRYAGRPRETWERALLVAVAAAAVKAPPDVPDPPAVTASGRRYWHVAAGGASWSQTLQFNSNSPGMIAVVRTAPTPLTSLHRLNPDGRRAPIVPCGNPQRPDPLGGVIDADIPADLAGAAWRLWQADEWGRWSTPTDCSGPEPERPSPPPPDCEDWWDPAAMPEDDALREPGVLRLRIAVPAASAVAPGGSPIQQLQVSCPNLVKWRTSADEYLGGNATIPVAGMTELMIEAHPTPTTRGARLCLPLSLSFVDTAGRTSLTTERTIEVRDPRPPKVILTGPKLIWTSSPDPIGWSEMTLDWDAAANAAGYRVFLGDGRRLAADLGITLSSGELRAKHARLIWERRNDVVNKGAFTLLNENLVKAAGTTVSYSTRLPGTLAGVQFVRVVPVAANGAEAEFRYCGLTPIAVPSAERPPIPVLRVSADAAGAAAVTLEAAGLRSDLTSTYPPEYRLRRTCTEVADPLYMPILRSGTLILDGSVWKGAVAFGAPTPLPPFVRFSWVAEIRYPPEPELEPGAVAADGAVRPGGGAPVGPCPYVWSDPSLPVGSMFVPALPDAPEDALVESAVGGAATVKIPARPTHSRAVGQYEAVVYRDPSTAAIPAPITLLARVKLDKDAQVTDPAAASSYYVVITDPIGRCSPSVMRQPDDR